MARPSFKKFSGVKLVQVRPAQSRDLVAIRNLMAQFDMFGEFLAEECVVAEIDGQICGFARVEVVDGVPYLRPIVVDSHAHGRGVGKALMHQLLDQYKGLTAISRGSAVGFYKQFGLLPVDWDQICAPFRAECLDCPDLDECQPQPMKTNFTK
ncbi:GNAT family N-acetyltransferase [bacterium]|nr:GNAT family N-acetyltransferase [bacterium]